MKSLAPPLDPARESVGLTLAWLRGDEELVEEIAARYQLGGDSLSLLLGVLNVYRRLDTHNELPAELYELALALALAN